MKEAASSLALLFALLTSACEFTDNAHVPPEAFGLERTVAELRVVTKAIDAANAVLAVDTNALIFVIDTSAKPNTTKIPVFVLSSKHLSKSDVIWVPSGCKCVFIQAQALRNWLDRTRVADGYGDDFDEAYVLAYILLHEMGHIMNGDGGAYLNVDGSAANMRGTDSKTAEAAADNFAKRVLQKELHGKGANAKTALEVVRSLKILTFNIYVANFVDHGLEEMLCMKPTLYWDLGYSHPNLIFRLMETVNELAPSPEIKKIVTTYAECRDRPAKYFDTFN